MEIGKVNDNFHEKFKYNKLFFDHTVRTYEVNDSNLRHKKAPINFLGIHSLDKWFLQEILRLITISNYARRFSLLMACRQTTNFCCDLRLKIKIYLCLRSWGFDIDMTSFSSTRFQ
jgi:hypothetical protein